MASELERAIAEVCAGNATEVKWYQKRIGDAGATQLADALHTNTSLKELGHGAPGEIMPALVTFDFD